MPADSTAKRTWAAKFRDAFRGIFQGVQGERSFAVHLTCAASVLVAGGSFHVSRTEWCLLAVCITMVLAAELFNSGIERLAKAVDTRPNKLIGDALDIASGAVLLTAIGASSAGVLIFLPHLWAVLS